jgi:hypothetical protein
MVFCSANRHFFLLYTMRPQLKIALIWILPLWSLLLWIACSNRPAQDDFFFIYLASEKGIIGGVLFQYLNWCTRYGGLLFGISVAKLSHIPFTYNVFSLLLMSAMSLEFSKWIKHLQNQYSANIQNSKAYGMLLCAALFIATPEKGETWFWLASTCTYLFSLICLSGLLRHIIFPKTNKTAYVWIAIYAFAVGSMNETLATPTLTALIILTIFTKIKKNTIRLQALIIAVLALSIAFIILLLAPGNALRASAFSPPNWSEWPVENLYLTWWLIRNAIIPYAGWILTGALIGGIVLFKANPKILPLRSSILITLTFPILLFCFQGMITKLTAEPAAQRTLFPIIAVLWLTLSLLFQSILHCTFKENIPPYLYLASVTIWWILCTTLWIQQAPTTLTYAKQFDTRISILSSPDYCDYKPALPKLPESGWLYSAEISNDTAHFSVNHLRKGLNMNCNPEITH